MKPKPMPLTEFIAKLRELAKVGNWKMFREAVKRRKEYFEANPKEGKF